jgi:DNA-binding MarR family transcriptional regulator
MKFLNIYNEHIIANIPSSILILDKDLKFVFFNHAFYNSFKIKSETIIGKPVSDIIPSDLLNNLKIEEKTSKTFKSRKAIRDFNLEIDASKFGEFTGHFSSFLQDKKLLNISYIPITKEKEIEHVMVIIDDVTEMKKIKEENDSANKKKPLTENSKRVFYGIMKHPNLTDQQLSNKLKIKRSTVTAIRNKLKKEKFFAPYNIPNFKLLEKTAILTVILCKFNLNSEKKVRAKVIQKLTNLPELIYNYTTDEQICCIFVSQDYTEIKKILDPILLYYEEKNIMKKDKLLVYFPFEISKLMINFSDLVKDLFGINTESEEIEKNIKSIKIKNLSKKEKVIFYALTKWPDTTDSELSKRICISRPTISTTRRFLFENDYLKTVIHPDLTKLGYELLMLDYSVFKPSLKKEEKENEIRSMASQLQTVFLMLSNTDFAALNLFKNYEDYNMFMFKLRTFLAKQTIECMPIPKVEFQKVKFAPLIKKIFNLNVSF